MKNGPATPEAAVKPDWRHWGWLILWAAALIWRVSYLTASFTYDELWSLLNFSGLDCGQILTDLSLPNNHPVNTLVLKLVSGISGNFTVLRLPVLAAGCASAVLTGKLLKKWTDDDFAGTAAQVLALFSLPLVIAGTRCRGYIWQVLFWELMLLGMTGYAQCRREREWGWLLLTAAAAVFCCFSVSTGIMLLVPAGAGWLLTVSREKRRNRRLWITGTVTGILLLWYYGSNYAALNAGRSWGIKIGSAGDWLRFFLGTAAVYLPVLTGGLIIWALIRVKLARQLAVGAVFPLLAAVLTGGGPARVYIYLAPAVCWGAGLGLAELRRRSSRRWLPAGLLVLGLVSGWSYWKNPEEEFTPPDYPAKWENRGDRRVLAVLPATAGYPLRCLVPEAAAESLAAASAPELEKLLILGKAIRGSDEEHGERTAALRTAGKPGKGDWYEYRLSRADGLKAGEDYLVRSRERRSVWTELGKSGKVLLLNEWLLPERGGVSVWYFRPAGESKMPEELEFYRIVGI